MRRRRRPQFTTMTNGYPSSTVTGNSLILGHGALQFVSAYDPDDIPDDEITPCTVTVEIVDYVTGKTATETFTDIMAYDERDAREQAWDQIVAKYRPMSTVDMHAVSYAIDWRKEASRKQAHVSSDPTVVSHCVFCGSGAIVARGDGGVECTLCNRSFSVMEQPLFSNMPSTDPGANIEATPFDPLMQEDPFDPGVQPPQQLDPAVTQTPPAGPAAPATPAAPKPAGGNPFGRAGALVARNGTPLDEEEFVLHHAIRLAREMNDA